MTDATIPHVILCHTLMRHSSQAGRHQTSDEPAARASIGHDRPAGFIDRPPHAIGELP